LVVLQFQWLQQGTLLLLLLHLPEHGACQDAALQLSLGVQLLLLLLQQQRQQHQQQ
jgi:hypothetical protein